jgi:putative peptidoglycan binding protein
MRDSGFDFDEWYERFPAPARPDRAERTERLATEGSWPVRHLASAWLALGVRWAPRWRRFVAVMSFVFVRAPRWVLTGLGRAGATAVRAALWLPIRGGAALARAVAAAAQAVAGGVRSLTGAIAGAILGAARLVGRTIGAVAGALARVIGFVVRLPRAAVTLAGRGVRVAVRAPTAAVGRVRSFCGEKRTHIVGFSAKNGRRVPVALRRWARRCDARDLVRPLQVAVSTVSSLAILAAFAVAGHGTKAVTLHTALRSGSAAVLDDPSLVPSTSGARRSRAAPAPLASSTTAPTTLPPVPPNPLDAAKRDPLPVGKGMWLYVAAESDGGDPARIVERAKANGVMHIYVRTGSSYDGFYAGPFLDRLLPVAHAGGVRVIGWDFPYLKNADDDVNRAVAAITYTTPTGQRLDGFAADVEVGDGVNLNPSTATTYSTHLRQRAGADYPLIATVPKPSPALTQYPFAQLLPSFDAVAPMVYWLSDDPAADLTNAVTALKAYGKPIIPVGQAYDASGEGGPKGVPSRAAIQRFIATADQLGTIGVSFWSWQGASQEAWDAVRDAPQFSLGLANPLSMSASQVRCYQALLATLGYPVNLTGVMDPATVTALRQYQAAAHLPVSALMDIPTQSMLLTPIQVAGPHR